MSQKINDFFKQLSPDHTGDDSDDFGDCEIEIEDNEHLFENFRAAVAHHDATVLNAALGGDEAGPSSRRD